MLDLLVSEMGGVGAGCRHAKGAGLDYEYATIIVV